MKKKLFHKSKFIKFKKQAFTLAEILVTLSIIGIVAAMTIPTLMQKQEEKKTVSALKKAYSTLSNAYTLAVQENGTPDKWNVTTSADLMSNFLPYFKIMKSCGLSTTNDCFASDYTHLDNTSWTGINAQYFKVQLLDGSAVLFGSPIANCGLSRGTNSLSTNNICSEIYIDINGPKAPNRVGVDFFFFYFTKYGIIPAGTKAENIYSFTNRCYKTTGGIGVGYGCAAWVVYNENMDYMHCDDLSWDGKKKCN